MREDISRIHILCEPRRLEHHHQEYPILVGVRDILLASTCCAVAYQRTCRMSLGSYPMLRRWACWRTQPDFELHWDSFPRRFWTLEWQIHLATAPLLVLILIAWFNVDRKSGTYYSGVQCQLDLEQLKSVLLFLSTTSLVKVGLFLTWFGPLKLCQSGSSGPGAGTSVANWKVCQQLSSNSYRWLTSNCSL